MFEQKFMDRVMELSREALTRPGTQPFGALVVRDGVIIGEGLNYAIAKHDPTSHGEIEAIRDACSREQLTTLEGCEMYAIGEPCPMCAVAIRLAGIEHLYYGATHAEAKKAFSPLAGTPYEDIDVEALRFEALKPVDDRSTPCSQHNAGECATVYFEWAERQTGKV
jgi:guanine deaminase